MKIPTASGLGRVLLPILVAGGFYWATSTSSSIAIDPAPRPLSPEWKAKVEAKEAARAVAGSNTQGGAVTADHTGPQPSRSFTAQVEISRTELEAAVEKEILENTEYFAAIALTDGEAAANEARTAFRNERFNALAVKEGKELIDVPGVEVGTHSISFSGFTYSGGNSSDPTNVVWFNTGSAWDVEYDMRNWTNPLWEDDAAWLCQSVSQDIYLWESTHTSGTDHWKSRDWGAQRTFDACAAEDRVHLRIFGASVPDSHGTFGEYTVGAAHYERIGCQGHCLLGWEPGEDAVKNAFAGQPFVGVIYYSSFNNQGTWKGYWNSGSGPYIELLY